jgi:SAM-dependent methyltransferase
MFIEGSEIHYLRVGLGVIRCIENAMEKSCINNDIRSILNFACGHGRELRFLKHRFPGAGITVSEIYPDALEFCNDLFKVKSFLSTKNFVDLPFPNKFDLIWCGSLLTHKDEAAVMNLLKAFHDHLLPGGLCLFTTHGQKTIELIETNNYTYNLTNTALEQLVAQYNERKFGYVNYENHTHYGISLVSKDYLTTIAENIGNWKMSFFHDHGWDNHQDVYAFKKLKD